MGASGALDVGRRGGGGVLPLSSPNGRWRRDARGQRLGQCRRVPRLCARPWRPLCLTMKSPALWLATRLQCWRGREGWRPWRCPRFSTHPLSSATAMPLQSLLPTPGGAPAPTRAAPTHTACNCASGLRFVHGGPRHVLGRRRRPPGGEARPGPDCCQHRGEHVIFDS